MPTVLYTPAAFLYIDNKVSAISIAATTLGVSKTAIAAFIAKENNSYASPTGLDFKLITDRALDRGLDYLAVTKSATMTNAQIRGEAAQVIVGGYADQMAGLKGTEGIAQRAALKADFITLADVGFANIKVVTAL